AYDSLDSLNNSGCLEEKIELLQNLLKVQNSDFCQELNMENFYREMADTYARMGSVDKARTMYEDALQKDPLWGWGWIGYLRSLEEYYSEELPKVLAEVKAKIAAGEKFRDIEDLKDIVEDEFA
ncbi:MAG: tetratricopeptide repeat protein, partial [Blautia sp.]|nr:tetratricopeptide repeat protein [Blautia sp.]